MTIEIYYSTVLDENFNTETIKEVLDQLYCAGELEVGRIFYQGQAVRKSASDFFNFDRMIEDIGEAAYEEGGEFATDFPELKGDKYKELEEIICNFLDEHVIVNFWRVKNVVEIEVTQEMIDEFLQGEKQ